MEIYMRICKILIVLLVAGMAGAFAGAALADTEESNPMLNTKYSIWLGGFFPKIDSTITINGKVIENPPELSFENVLGLEDSKSVFWGGASWRISKRNYLEFEFANLNRDGSIQVESDFIEIGDSIARFGARIDTEFDVTLGRLTYGYSIVKNEKTDIQLKAGVHIADIGASLQLSGAVEECQPGEVPPDCSVIGGQTDRLESSDVTLPLPHLGASFAYAFTPKLGLRSQVIGFALKINDIKGSIVEIDADLVYHPWRRFGLGAGFRYFKVNVDSKGSSLNGEFDFQYYGPVAYGIFTF
jgi:hypothetical protein